jgi:Flp pilus assembly protein TadD
VLAAGCSTAPLEPDPSISAEQLYEDSVAATQARGFEEAERLVKTSLQRNPLNAASHVLLANLLARRGDSDQAIVGFTRAVSLQPTHPEALFNLGTLYLRRGDAILAANMLERAVDARPEHPPALNNLGHAYFQCGLPELAGAAFEETLHLDPENQVALGNLSKLAEGSGDREAAQAYRARLEASRRKNGDGR